MKSLCATVALACLFIALQSTAAAHHTLGINQAGKATDSPQIPVDHEIRVNDLLFQVTVLPAHPEPGMQTRIIANAT